MFNNNDDNLVTDFRRRAPQNLRPAPGHLSPTPRTLAETSAASPDSAVAESNYMKFKSEEQEQVMRRAEEQRRDMAMLKDYNPWGKPGGGAPKPETDQKLCGLNPDVNRNHDESNPAYVEQFGRPGNGAPLRSENGQPLSVVQRHPDIRNQPELYNEELKKKSINTGLQPLPTYGTICNVTQEPQYPPQDHSQRQQQYYPRAQMLGARPHPTDENTKNMLRSKLDQQIAQKRDSKVNESIIDPCSDFAVVMGQGVVGTVQRDQSGKVMRSNPLGGRGVDGLREYTGEIPMEGLVYDLGKPGPGNPTRTRSGNIHPAPRGMVAKDLDDPFRIGRQQLSPRDPRHTNQVFPTHLEQEASDRANKRMNPSVSPIANIHTVQNGYYGEQPPNQEQPYQVQTAQSDPGHMMPSSGAKQVGTVYSAVFRTRENYLSELAQQIEEKKVNKDQEKRKAKKEDEQFTTSTVYNDVFGKPGNGAPRLSGGSLQTTRKRLDEIETQGFGVQNAKQFRK